MAIIDRVKWDGSPDVFAWKYPEEGLSNGTVLVVNESQEAFVVNGGVVDGPFGPGRHVLENENIPLISKLYKLPYGGKAPFTAEVWYINRTVNLDFKWGTPDPIQLQDPRFGLMVPVRAFGQYGIEIIDGKRFLLKLVGTLKSFTQPALADYLRGFLIPNIKTEIANLVVKRNISVLDIATELLTLSAEMRGRMGGHVEEYGLGFKEFNIHSINVPEDDPVVISLKKALAKRAEMGILGYTYQQERSYDVMQTAAGNEGAGGVMSTGIGLGVGAGIGTAIGGAMGQVAGNFGSDLSPRPSPSSAPVPPSPTDVSGGYVNKIDLIKQLAELRQQGLLTDEEFVVEKKKILG